MRLRLVSILFGVLLFLEHDLYAEVNVVDYSSFKNTVHPTVGWRHLELGASNYGPSFQGVYSGTSDNRFDVLTASISSIVYENSDHENFILYLNDIDELGLIQASLALKDFLGLKFSDKNFTLVKMCRDMFEVDNWPEIDSVYLLHPFDRFLARIIYHQNNSPVEQKIKTLFRRLVVKSTSGLLVKESNYSGGFADYLLEKVENGVNFEGFRLEPAQSPVKQSYIFPDGSTQSPVNVVYRVRPEY